MKQMYVEMKRAENREKWKVQMRGAANRERTNDDDKMFMTVFIFALE